MLACRIDSAARIAPDVQLGHGLRIHGNVEIAEGCSIGDFSVLGHPAASPDQPPLQLGRGARIRSHAVLYEGSRIGPGLETGHHVVIREGARIGADLRLGNFSDIEGQCRIGDHVRMHGYVHVGRGSEIGDFVWLHSQITLMNDPLPPSHLHQPVRIGDMAVICVSAQLMPGAVIGRGAMVAAGAIASGVVPAGHVIAGADGRIAGRVAHLVHLDSGTRHPWPQHFRDAYPAEVQERILALAADIAAEVAAGIGAGGLP